MTARRLAVLCTWLVGLSAFSIACGQGTGAPPAEQQSTGAPAAAGGSTPASGPTAAGVVIGFTIAPDPPEAGDNTVEVTVRNADGSPMVDASVAAVFSMPAMPSMNMPAMRSDTTLSHVGEGRYRGTGQISMGGTWNVAVTVTRGGEKVGTRKLSIIAR